MYIAKKQISIGGQIFQAGDKILSPTKRMIELGLVELESIEKEEIITEDSSDVCFVEED